MEKKEETPPSLSSLPGKREEKIFPPFEELTKLIYGEPKVGKSSFADKAAGHYFLATEPGHDFLESPIVRIDRWGWDLDQAGKPKLAPGEKWVGPVKLPNGTIVTNFKDHIREVWMAKQKGGYPFKVVSVDIVDNLYQMCLTAICRAKGLEYPPETDFGKTWKEVTTEWKTWIQRLLDCMSVTFITHTTTDKIELKQPNGMTKEIERRIPTFKGNKAAQFLDGVVNAMGFAFFDASGQRCITFAGDPRLASGDRSGLLEKLGSQPLVWKTVEAAYNEAAKAAGVKLRSKWA